MKPTFINHDLKEIRLAYNSDIQLSDFEQTALTEYLSLHNALLNLKKKHAALNGSLFEMESKLPAIEKDFETLENEIKKCGPLAGYTSEECDEMGITEGKVDDNEIIKTALAFQDKFNAYHDRTTAFHVQQRKWREEADAFDEEMEKFEREYSGPVIMNWKEMEIDSAALHDDMQALYGIRDDVCLKKRKQLVKTWNEFISMFKVLNEKVSVIFNRVDTVDAKAKEIIKSGKPFPFGLN